ncbi:MAG: S8 family serine peptidase, partial [Candidatus Eisenbacteria bacterium]|nr:S8 family serine peptidase [Candidatus Eisenbacteria bacterium]
KAVQAAHDAGVLVVASAGNNDQPGPAYCPANVPEAIMVTGVDPTDVKASFADYHPSVAISAPSVGLRSAYPFGSWAIGDGCSFATPLVSGGAALIRSVRPEVDPASLTVLVQTSVQSIDHLPANQPYAGRLGTGRLFLPLGLGETTDAPGPDTRQRGVALQVIPNPAAGSVGLTLQGRIPTGTSRLEALDPAGRVVYVDPSFDGHSDWSFTACDGVSLPAGTYFLRVLDGTTVVAEGRVVRVR